VMYLSYMRMTRSGVGPFSSDAVITIIGHTKNKITLSGDAGCGGTSTRISHLVRMQ
jgi:hypothetical protein